MTIICIFFYRLCSSTQDLKAIRVHSGEEQIFLRSKGIDEPTLNKLNREATQCIEQIVAVVK